MRIVYAVFRPDGSLASLHLTKRGARTACELMRIAAERRITLAKNSKLRKGYVRKHPIPRSQPIRVAGYMLRE